MSYDNSVFTAAQRELSARRRNAEKLAEKRMVEVGARLPEIAQINEALMATSLCLARLILHRDGDFEQKLIQIRDENLDGQAQIKKLLVENGYAVDYLDVKYFCPMCKDEGFVGNTRCDCFSALLGKYAVTVLNSSSQMKLSSFDNFSLGYYKEPTAYTQMVGVLEYCKNYAKNFSLASSSVFMLGLTGLGKTHLSLAIASEVLAKGFHVAYDSIVNFLRVIEKEHFGRTESDTLALILSVDLLILDDLGAEFDSSFYVSTIYNIVNTRLNKGLPTIISSNFTTAQLQKRYDDRIMSRLFAMYDYLPFAGSDVRLLKRLEKQL